MVYMYSLIVNLEVKESENIKIFQLRRRLKMALVWYVKISLAFIKP